MLMPTPPKFNCNSDDDGAGVDDDDYGGDNGGGVDGGCDDGVDHVGGCMMPLMVGDDAIDGARLHFVPGARASVWQCAYPFISAKSPQIWQNILLIAIRNIIAPTLHRAKLPSLDKETYI